MRTRVFSRPGTHPGQRTTALLPKAALSAILFNIPSALAVTDTYTGADGGNWSTAANWTAPGSVHAVPINGDDAVLSGNATISSVNFNVNYTAAGLASLTVDSPGTGSMTLKQTIVTTMIAASETIGSTTLLNSYTQSAGTNTAGILTIASGNNSSGNYTLSGGAGVVLTVNTFEIIGNAGNGTFIQSGGTHTLNADLQIGETGGTGTYLLQSGAFNENTNVGVGQAGVGTFTQSGGTANITLGLYVGSTSGATGTFSLSSGSLTVGSGSSDEFIGYNGNGTFTQTGGIHTVVTALTIGANIGSTGTFTLSNGSLSVGATAPAFSVGVSVGYNGTGTFTQSGGTHTVGTAAFNQDLIVGQVVTGVGTYTLNNAAATLTVNGNELIGEGATGTSSGGTITQYGGAFNQSAGSHNVSGFLDLAANGGSTGSFTLSGGTLTTATAGAAFTNSENIGEFGVGTFTQSGGLHTVGTPAVHQTLFIGDQATSIGTYTLNNSTATLTVNGTELVGSSATGTSTQFGGTFSQSAGNHTVTDYLTIGYLAGSSGGFFLSGGNLTVSTTGAPLTLTEVVGQFGNASFVQSGGNHTIGTPAANQILHIGQYSGAFGGYSMNNAASLLTVNGLLYLGTNFGATGSFFLSSGSLTVSGPELIGYAGTGTFTQSGGTNSIGNLAAANYLDLGGFFGATGTYTVNNANATLTVVNGGCYVGGISTAAGGTGTFNISAGNVSINGPLKIWTTGSVVNFSGGTLSIQSLDTSGTPSRFNWTGGTLNFMNGFTLDSNFTLGPSLIVSLGKTLAAPAGQSIINNGSLTLTGGAVSAPTVINNTSLSGFGSIIATSFANNGQLTVSGGNLAINVGSAAFANSGAISLAPGFQLQLTASTVANDGSINLNGGAITGSLPFTNASDGIISGPGTLSVSFANQGTLVVLNGTTRAGSFTNTGIIEMSGLAAQLGSGGTITNNAIIEGFGKISDAVINNGTIQPTSGTLILSGILTNPAAGLLTAATGNVLLVSSGLATNAGILSLTGGTFDNGNQPLTNTGQITGYGTFRTGGAGLTNNSAITFTGGTSTINGPVTNAINKTIVAKNDPAIFTGPVTNNGTFIVTNTTVTFAGTYTGNAYISDPSTNIFQSSVTISPGGLMTGSTGDLFIFAGPVTNNGNFTNAGALQVSANITNNANFTQSGPQNWSLASTFTNTAGAAAFVASNAKLGGVVITGGTVNLTSSKFVLEPASKSAMLAALQANIADHSLISSTLPANFGLALLDNALLNKPSFGGNSADAGSLLIGPELLGDANADGHVDAADLSTVLNNFGATTLAWTSGNFDYQSTIDLTDLADVLNNFGQFNPNASTAPRTNDASPLAVPEPASVLVFTLLLPFAQRRRRAWIPFTRPAFPLSPPIIR